MAADHNPLACKVTMQNAAYNKVESAIVVKHMDLRREFPPPGVDVIMANLHHELLAELFHNPLFWKARMYILSGFMPGGEEQLLASLPESPPPFLERHGLDKWRVWVLGY
jgi:ribosomal protein L11 methylase PrmA